MEGSFSPGSYHDTLTSASDVSQPHVRRSVEGTRSKDNNITFTSFYSSFSPALHRVESSLFKPYRQLSNDLSVPVSKALYGIYWPAAKKVMIYICMSVFVIVVYLTTISQQLRL
jgi:hypothetical protein